MSVIATSPHSKALAQLYPKTMDAEQNAVAIVFDGLLSDLDAAKDEVSPSTATTTLERWEAAYDLPGDGTDDDRWTAVRLAYAAQPGISAADYIAIAKSLGYDISIPYPPRMFRAGVSRAGSSVYDMDEQYTWTVKVENATEEDGAALKTALEAAKIPFTKIRWSWKALPLQIAMTTPDQAQDPIDSSLAVAMTTPDQAQDPIDSSFAITFTLEDT